MGISLLGKLVLLLVFGLLRLLCADLGEELWVLDVGMLLATAKLSCCMNRRIRVRLCVVSCLMT